MRFSIDVVSDVVCPWCYIGKRRLASALALLQAERPGLSVVRRWLPYFLAPDLPPQGEPYRPFVERKFGGAAQVQAMQARIAAAGAGEGLRFVFDRMQVRPNTLDAHRLIHRAQAAGEADGLVEALFEAHFIEGENLSERTALARIASRCGFDEGQTLAYLVSGEDADEVRAQAERAQRLGITGVPFFILDGRYGIGGAQEPQVLLDGIRQVLSEPRS